MIRSATLLDQLYQTSLKSQTMYMNAGASFDNPIRLEHTDERPENISKLNDAISRKRLEKMYQK